MDKRLFLQELDDISILLKIIKNDKTNNYDYAIVREKLDIEKEAIVNAIELKKAREKVMSNLPAVRKKLIERMYLKFLWQFRKRKRRGVA